MASSRHLLSTTTIFHNIHRTISSKSSLSHTLSSYTPITLPLSTTTTKPYPFQSFKLSYSAAASTASSIDEFPEIVSETVDSDSHPWPEWVLFLDKLKSKGYFNQSLLGEGDAVTANVNPRADLNLLKTGCLSFARERFDICKSLSREDIETVVKYGCPSVNRKTVNSAKRLRAFVKLNERDVCGDCGLRGSCDRAYMVLKDSEADARTVDIMRMLLVYAVDPSAEKPNGWEYVETSARKLLSELIELSETTLDPALLKPVVKPTQRRGSREHVGRHERREHVGKHEGRERVVNLEKRQNIEMKKGDWICSKCDFLNFSRNIQCHRCNEDGPKQVSVDDVEMKKGDWNCPKCEFMNFSKNKSCLRCQGSRPKRELLPGEWECPSCDFMNFRKNATCYKCRCDRPKDNGKEYEDQIWNSPR
ncbi:zinc finger protein VAR3, chloroplastic-like [Papaver somniferum]|uniref:zinc finger protein VAR3, chloroplastic-like n=1 Tax=Papaver somniferum TaxID=3469 RepID=UPI000E702D43|nr:zinc finger protein VAR3, chloroplastic-like [Papaver somniferum]